jgi:hypothetical protein
MNSLWDGGRAVHVENIRAAVQCRMARRIRLAAHLSVDELDRRYRAAREPHERWWWQILWLLAKGQTATAIAESTGYSRYWIGQIAKRYNAEGPRAW